MSTRRQRQILRNRKLEFQRKMDENIKKAEVKPEPKEEPKEETKIVKKKKTTKKEDK